MRNIFEELWFIVPGTLKAVSISFPTDQQSSVNAGALSSQDGVLQLLAQESKRPRLLEGTHSFTCHSRGPLGEDTEAAEDSKTKSLPRRSELQL